MRLRLAALAALIPTAALAAPAIVAPTLGPSLPEQTYHAVALAAAGGGAPRNGWTLRASVDGRWTYLRARGLDWAADPSVPASDVQAGVEWRRGAAAAVLGYGQYDQGATRDPARWDRTVPEDTLEAPSDPGVLGLSFVLRSR